MVWEHIRTGVKVMTVLLIFAYALNVVHRIIMVELNALISGTDFLRPLILNVGIGV